MENAPPGSPSASPNRPSKRPPSRRNRRQHSVRRHLRVEVDAYDETIRRFIPGYDRMLSVVADAVAQAEPARVYDLGAGTGGLSEALLERPGIGVVELLDVDAEMLERAHRRLRRFGARARCSQRSYDEPFAEADAFVASLALHHLPTIEAKAALFARVFDALRAGGVFVNADVNMPANGERRDRDFRRWADHLVGSGISEKEAWEHFDAWAAEDTYLPVKDELDALRSIGFEARCVWSDTPLHVVVATRGDEPLGGA